jgi:hypothetical protein
MFRKKRASESSNQFVSGASNDKPEIKAAIEMMFEANTGRASREPDAQKRFGRPGRRWISRRPMRDQVRRSNRNEAVRDDHGINQSKADISGRRFQVKIDRSHCIRAGRLSR